MTFKEAMEHYRAGTATEEQRQMVEEELEKNKLIAEYMDAQWEEETIIPTAPMEEMKQVRKTLRRRNVLIVLTSLVLVAALLLATVYIGIPAAESRYWDPAQNSYGMAYCEDLELMLAAYTELFCPDVNLVSVTSDRTGFARYDITIQYWDANRGGDSHFAFGTIDKGVLDIPQGVLRHCPINIFDRATYPFYPAPENRKKNITEKLKQLPEYITVTVAVSFPEDKSMEELLAFQDSLKNGSIGWVGIRTAPETEQLLPLCGMNPFSGGVVRSEINDHYPSFDLTADSITPEKLSAHFQALLKFSADQAAAGTGIDERYTIHESYYTQSLDYVTENGVYSYGCYVFASPAAILALIESGDVSSVHIEDVWISA